jgi:hypothetical protein
LTGPEPRDGFDYRKSGRLKFQLIPAAARMPASPAGRFALEVLRADGETLRSDLIEKLARACYREEIRTGGWALDLGLLGARIFFPEVVRETQAGFVENHFGRE